MVFDWKDFLALAKALQNSGDSFPPEATKRTIVSRAYYVAFCFLRNYAENHLGFRQEVNPLRKVFTRVGFCRTRYSVPQS